MNTEVYPTDDLHILQEKMNDILKQLNFELSKNSTQISDLNDIMKCAMDRLNDDVITFGHYEILEDAFDTVIYKYQKTKNLLKTGRLIQCFIEQKTLQKECEIRFAKNVMAQYGIEYPSK